jgi:hypothetical protein
MRTRSGKGSGGEPVESKPKKVRAPKSKPPTPVKRNTRSSSRQSQDS